MDGAVTNADSGNDVAEAYAPTLGLILTIVVNATKNVNLGLNASMVIVVTLDFLKSKKIIGRLYDNSKSVVLL